MTYNQVTIIDGSPVPAQIINDMSAAVKQHDLYFGGLYRSEIVTVGTVASVTFSSIPATMRRLTLWLTARGDTAALFAALLYRVGGDTSASYRHVIKFDQNGTNSQIVTSGGTSAQFGYVTAASVASGIWGVARLDFVGWNSPHANGLKAVSQFGEYDAAGNYVVGESMTDYAGTATYNSLTILPSAGNFITGSQFFISGE